MQSLVEGSDIVFHDLFKSQNEASKALLRAVAADGCVASPTSDEFLARHGFKSHSTVRSALNDLVNNDLLYRSDDGSVVYDRLFGIWLSRLQPLSPFRRQAGQMMPPLRTASPS